MPPKKESSKSAAKKGKSDEPKKGGKDDKKGGKGEKKGDKKAKEPPDKGKGKDDGKKGKKPVSESEEFSEEEEELMTEGASEDESEEEVVPKKGDKGKGKAALKGASKAMAMKGFKPPPKQEETKEKTQMKKGIGAVNLKKMSDVHIKGASKAMMGFATEGQKKSITAAKAQKTADVKSHLKGASKVLTGLTGKASPFSFSPKKQQAVKEKPKTNLKSTSRLFLGLSKKKKPTPGGKPLLGTGKLLAGLGAKSSADKKPNLSGFSLFNKKDDAAKETPPPKKTINLNSLGDKGKMAAEAKGLGGKFKGMFGKKKEAPQWKKSGLVLGKIAAATNWLTARFLNTKGQGRLGVRAGGRQQKRLSFADRNSQGRQAQYYNEAYEYDDDDEYGYDQDYYDRLIPECNSHRQPRGYDQYDPYGEEMDYYEEDEWVDEYGYYDDEGNFYYDDEYYYDDYINYSRYPNGYYGDEYEEYYGEDGLEYYYGDDGMLHALQPEAYSAFVDPYNPELYGEYSSHNLLYNYGISDLSGMLNGGYDMIPSLNNDQLLAYTDYPVIYNPYQQPTYIDAGLEVTETGQMFREHEQMYFPPAETFRFPRPQVRLFGKDRLEIENMPRPVPPPPPPPPPPPLPPSSPNYAAPNLVLGNLETPNMQYQQALPAYPPANIQYSTVMNQQQTPIFPRQVLLPPALSGQQEPIPFPQPPYPPLTSFQIHPPSPSPQTDQSLLLQGSQVFQMGQIPPVVQPIQSQMQTVMQSTVHSPLTSPQPLHQMTPHPSPQLSLNPGLAMAPLQHHHPTHPLYLQSGVHMDQSRSPQLQRRGLAHQTPVATHRPISPINRQRPPSPVPSQLHNRRGFSVRAQPSLSRGQEGIGIHRTPSAARPQSPPSSPIASPKGSLRKRVSQPPSPGQSCRQHPPPDAVSQPASSPHFSRGRKQATKLRQSPSPPSSSLLRRSPTLPERSQSPSQSFCPSSPHRPPSPSPSRISGHPLPTRSSTRRLRGVGGGRSHVPMGAVKPSPANPYFQGHGRHGAPLTQHVAPFRSSLHSGSVPHTGQPGPITRVPVLARTGSHNLGLRESKGIGSPQEGFRRPVGRGQPLVRMPRNQPSLHSWQSSRAPSQVFPLSPQASSKKKGPQLPQPSVRRMQSKPPSPHPVQRLSPLPPRSASPMHHQPFLFPQSPQSIAPTAFQAPISPPGLPPGALSQSQSITQYDYRMVDPGPPPMLSDALPTSPLSQLIPSPYIQNGSIPTPLQRNLSNMPAEMNQNVSPYAPLDSTSYSSPLQRNANLYTTVLSPPQPLAPPVFSAPSSPRLSSAMFTPQLRNASYASPLQRHLSPIPLVSNAPPSPSSQQRNILSGGLRTSHIQGLMYKLPDGTLTIPHGVAHNTVTTESGGERLSPSVLSNALQNTSLRQATYRLPDGSLVMRTEPAGPSSGSPQSSSVLSSALLNPSLRQATYRLPDGTFITNSIPTSTPSSSLPMLSSALSNSNLRNMTYKLPDGTLATRKEPEPEPSSPMLSSALLNCNLHSASYKLPSGSFLSQPANEAQKMENKVASPGLSSALMNANLSRAKFQLPNGSSLFSRNQPQAPTSPHISGAILNKNLRSAHYRLPGTSLLKPPGSSDSTQSQSLDLSKALSNQSIRSATYRLPDGTLLSRSQPAAAPQTPDLSNALSKNPNLRAAKYRLPNDNIMTRLGAPRTPEIRSPNLAGALKNPQLQRASFRLPSYAVVSPQVQGLGAEQHWAQSPGVSEIQQNVDVWGAERVLPHGTVQNLNKWSMYRDGELLPPHSQMAQGIMGPEPSQWNLNREGEPQGQWFDKVELLEH